jgi:hypothetical protein
MGSTDGHWLYDFVTWLPIAELPQGQRMSFSKAADAGIIGPGYSCMPIHLSDPTKPGIKNKDLQKRVKAWQKKHATDYTFIGSLRVNRAKRQKEVPVPAENMHVLKPTPVAPAAATMEDAPPIAVPAQVEQRREVNLELFTDEERMDLYDPNWRFVMGIVMEDGKFFYKRSRRDQNAIDTAAGAEREKRLGK